MATLTVRLYDYETLRAQLTPGCRIAVLSCGSCARLSDGLGGEQGLASLTEKLVADGFQVICREVLPIACAGDSLKKNIGEDGIRRLLEEADVIIPLACAAGVKRAEESLPGARICVVTKTVGKGSFTNETGARLTESSAETGLKIDTVEGISLAEAAARLGLHAGHF
jgi:hypothetical protein